MLRSPKFPRSISDFEMVGWTLFGIAFSGAYVGAMLYALWPISGVAS